MRVAFDVRSAAVQKLFVGMKERQTAALQVSAVWYQQDKLWSSMVWSGVGGRNYMLHRTPQGHHALASQLGTLVSAGGSASRWYDTS